MTGARILASVNGQTGGLPQEVPMPFISHLTRGETLAERFDIPRNDTGVTDRSQQFQYAVDNSEGTLVLPPGRIRLAGAKIVAAQRHGLVIKGQGASNGTSGSEGTQIIIDKAAADGIEFQSCKDAGIRDVEIISKALPTSGYAVRFTRDAALTFGSTRCYAERVNFHSVHNPILIDACTNTEIDRVDMREIFGTHGIHVRGTTASLRTDVVNISNVVGDITQGYSILYSNRGAWASGTSYVAGDIVSTGGRYYVCTQSGVSGSTAPTGRGTYGNRQVTGDGSVLWHFVCPTAHAWVTHDSYAYTVHVSHARLISGAVGARMTDGTFSGSSFPMWLRGNDVDCDHCLLNGVSLNAGEDAFFDDLWVSSVALDNGLTLASTHRGGLRLHNSEINFSARHGILLNSGPKGNQIMHSQIGCNGRAQTNVYHGIAAAAGASHFQIIGNRLDAQPTTVINDQAYGVLVSSVNNDRYTVAFNNGEGNQSGLLSDFTSGSTRVVMGNQ